MKKFKNRKAIQKRLKKTGSKKKLSLLHFTQGDNHHLKSKKSRSYKNRTHNKRTLSNSNQTEKLSKYI